MRKGVCNKLQVLLSGVCFCVVMWEMMAGVAVAMMRKAPTAHKTDESRIVREKVSNRLAFADYTQSAICHKLVRFF
jgi:hypothetical protein